MTDQELEARLRAWYRTDAGADSGAPLLLRADVAAIPRAVPRPGRWSDRGLRSAGAAAVAIAAVVVAAVAVALVGRESDSRVAAPSPSPTPRPQVHSENTFGVRYTLPDGWVTTIDNPDWFSLAPLDGRMLPGGGGLAGQLDIDGIVLYRDPVIAAQDASCMKAARPGLGHTVDDFLAYLRSHPGLVTTEPVPVTMAGMAGMQVDVSLAPTWTQTCPFNELPSVTYMTHEGAPNYLWGVDGHEHQRMAFLADAQGRVFVVGINALDAARLNVYAHEAAPTLDSLEFLPRPSPPADTPDPSP